MPTWNVSFDLRVNFEDPRLVRTLIEAEALARTIRSLPIPPQLRARLDRLNILRAVRGTTGIEGSSLSEAEVGRILDTPDSVRVLSMARQREEREARNAARVVAMVAQFLDEDPETAITEPLIARLHRVTTEGIDYEYNTPGQYRDHAASAGEYVPPRTGSEVQRLMAEFVRWLNQPPVTQWPPIGRAIAAHFYFISIHPFGDGNGRTARAIESFLLYQANINALGFYSLANFYYRNRPEYIAMLDHVRFRSDGDLTPFIRFAAGGLLEELEQVFAEVIGQATLIAFRDYAREALEAAGKSGTPAGARMLAFVYALGAEEVDIGLIRGGGHPLHSLFRGVSPRTVSRDLAFLEELELIARDADRVRARIDVMERYRTTS